MKNVLVNQTSKRKFEHIDIVVKEDVTVSNQCNEIYSEIKLVHSAFPGIDYRDIDTSIEFLGYTLKAPLMITGMTGGHSSVREVNEKLARLAQEHGIAIGVGSQRAMIENKGDLGVIKSYTVVRKIARDVPVIGNIGLNTLSKVSVREVIDAVNMLEADALAIHLNPGQELVQPEGDTCFRRELLDRVRDLIGELGVPVVVKEVGNGLSLEVVRLFSSIGVRYFDVAGACGTNWVLVEGYRAGESGFYDKQCLARKLSKWGIPTPLSVIEARWASPQSFIIASGGVWDGFKAAVNIVLGADMAGFAAPLLRRLLRDGLESASNYIREYVMEFKATMFLTGSSSVSELKGKPVYLSYKVLSMLYSRGIDWARYRRLIS